ncbi:hypothetical protein [Hydrogenoanaerobacterium sp.]|uniref:hypothetical protein n=1 Tax=Hydrogenoanaerobacterium sp. TaxID=2953763 RepID=UPI00289ACB4E|nr:hypothetical protein [Hydrogenoanaerobacterium sp.]
MDDRVNNVEPDELPVEQEATAAEQNVNILEEIKGLNQKLGDPNYQTYKKSTYWHQQATTMDEVKQESHQKEMIECLQRIEEKLTKIEALLEK